MMNAIVFLILFDLLIVTPGNYSARILVVIPTPSISHQVVFRPLTQELARRGHDVTVITTDPAFPKGEAPANLTEIDLYDVSYDFWRKNFKVSNKGWKNDPVFHMKMASELFTKVFEVQLGTEEFKRVLKDSFELVFVEACVRPAFVLSHVFKAPMILLSSIGAGTGIYDIVGAPTHFFLYPPPVQQRLYNLTFYEKITTLYHNFWFQRNYYLLEKTVDEMLKFHFEKNVPIMIELKKDVDMLFLNMHPILEGNQPVPPIVVHVWGIHQNPLKELPKNLKSYLDNSKLGVIYVSFGTNVHPSMLPQHKVQIMIKVLSQLPYDVMWKWDRDKKLEMAENIKTKKWFPQSDLLRHPKVKLFITQGGLQSTDEAFTAGVPLIGIPIVADQSYKTEKYVHHKIGLQLDLNTLTDDQFAKAIKTVIEDNSYRSNLLQLGSLMRDQPMQPLERAVWWTEHVLRHGGGTHLRAPAANISWAEYYELEFVSILLLGLLVIIFIGVRALNSVYRFIARVLFENGRLKKE